MKINIAVNGYGRIGRCVVRALYESRRFSDRINLVAVNETADAQTIYHLTKYDSTHGRFPLALKKEGSFLVIGDTRVRILQEKNIMNLPWKDLNIDAVLECTGIYNDRQSADLHLLCGAKKVIFSQPAGDEMDATIVYGVNHQILKKNHTVISNASCTTNCIIPVLFVLEHAFGIESGSVTTIHSAMHDQPVIDAYNPDLRKTRSALQSIIPVNTALEKGISKILPSMEGRFETLAIRVPTTNVSIMDITVLVNRDADVRQINDALIKASEGELKDILGVTDEHLVSCDFNHDPRSAVIDLYQTRVSKSRLVKIQAWFDNEWGYSNRMLDTTIAAFAAG
ncbi:MAG: erythrose-4-phosphate dehydrogenase [Proteobacteria bacterium]|nr:erythrose-4-phosphate dehydrogenase [Pseudomonadota bacterium]MBU1388583.1 erythrose-4-phosphate dehydrogenase [Pseudomonadota bacterium]MBU1541739.1 erythrose-4-phosphate dehydrogenase [Pseudomonadota bacterium]MBU2431506.1 erythrose-4-phosphate dehydrogenase [Pseudomonadota bacterium]MBU2482962.1 erythrose-4-phosphate dehydrogenase [Pseudomonadota bacterium]